MGIYGIGHLTAVTILAELGDARRFSSSRDAVRYSGLEPWPVKHLSWLRSRQHQSGQLPRPAGMRSSHPCTGSPTTQGPPTTRDNATSGIAFCAYDRVSTLNTGVFEAQ